LKVEANQTCKGIFSASEYPLKMFAKVWKTMNKSTTQLFRGVLFVLDLCELLADPFFGASLYWPVDILDVSL